MRIGEVAKLLDISVETIRYYESEGIVSPGRKEGSKYREYETWDIFYLMECMAYRSLGLSVKEIAAALHKEPLSFMIEKLIEQQNVLEKDIQEKSMLLAHLKHYEQMLEMLPLNLGNYWMVKQPACYLLEYTSGNNDEYSPIWADQRIFSAWMNKRPFIRSAQLIELNDCGEIRQGAWVMVVDKDMVQTLEVPMDDSVYELPQMLCLTTVIDGGERGDLTDDKFEAILTEIRRRGYEINGRMMANIVHRYWENGKLHRIIEVSIPVKK